MHKLAQRLRGPAVVLGLFSLLGGAACTLLNSLDGYTQVHADASVSTDAGGAVDASGEAAVEAGPGCLHAVPPQRPDPALDQPGSISVQFAASSYALGLGGAADAGDSDGGAVETRIGLDLDGLCTCAPDGPACLNKNASGVACDLPLGVDNASASLFDLLAPYLTGPNNLDATRSISDGRYTLLFEIAGWNGTDNDSTVFVRVTGSGMLEHSSVPRDGGAPSQPDAAPSVSAYIPALDGNDVWSYDDRGVQTDLNAYVRDGVLVSFVNARFKLGSVRFPIEYGTIVANISKVNGLYTLSNGVLTGRVSATAFLTSLQQANDPNKGNPVPLCRGKSSNYGTLRAIICRSIDLSSSPTTDGKDLTCESLSTGIGFRAVQAQEGTIYTPPADVERCGAGYIDTCD